MIHAPFRAAMRRGVARGTVLAMLALTGAIGGLLGLGALVDRVFTGPIGDRAISALAIGPHPHAPDAYTHVVRIGGRVAYAEFAVRLDPMQWAIASEPHPRTDAAVSIEIAAPDGNVSRFIVEPKGRECRVVIFIRADRVDAGDCLSPVAGD